MTGRHCEGRTLDADGVRTQRDSGDLAKAVIHVEYGYFAIRVAVSQSGTNTSSTLATLAAFL
jgi:hypothetical protein